MKKTNEKQHYDEIKDWDFSQFEVESVSLTNWNFNEIINKLATKKSKILDLGTGGGENVLRHYPDCAEILGTDYSEEMIKTANENLKRSGRKNISFRVMDNLHMDVPENYFNIVTARHTVIDPEQILKCLKKGGYLIIRGVDKDDCWSLKMTFKRGQGYHDVKPISITDYENVLNAGFEEVELVPIHKREYFKDKKTLQEFLKKVPIIDDFSEELGDKKDYYTEELEEDLLESYIEKNTYDGKIKLLRRYYGITARKQPILRH